MTIKEQQTRQRIVEAATVIFHQHGFNRVTMDEIAENLGMSKKTLYKYYAGKEDLIIAVVEHYRLKFDACISPIVLEVTDDFVDKLLRLGSAVSTMISNAPICFIKDLEKYLPDVWRDHAAWKHRKTNESLREILQEGIQKGVFRTFLSSEVIILMFLTLTENLFKPDVLAQLPITPSQLYISIMRVFFEGIMTDNGREQFRYKMLSDAEKKFKIGEM